jgi:hypothetical protein
MLNREEPPFLLLTCLVDSRRVWIFFSRILDRRFQEWTVSSGRWIFKNFLQDLDCLSLGSGLGLVFLQDVGF